MPIRNLAFTEQRQEWPQAAMTAGFSHIKSSAVLWTRGVNVSGTKPNHSGNNHEIIISNNFAIAAKHQAQADCSVYKLTVINSFSYVLRKEASG